MSRYIAILIFFTSFFSLLNTNLIADTWTVTDPGDSLLMKGTLRGALDKADDGDIIEVRTNVNDIAGKIEVSQDELIFIGRIKGKSGKADLPSIDKFRFLYKGAEIRFINCNIRITDDLRNSYNHFSFEKCNILIYEEYPDMPFRDYWSIVTDNGGTADFIECVFKYRCDTLLSGKLL